MSVRRGVGLRERHKAGRRTRILDAARELLREDPSGVVSVERIAERAEVAPATVYNLIGPRDQLWRALAAWFMDELERRLAAGTTGQESADALGRARAVVSATVELFVDEPIVARRMLRGWEHSGLALDDSPLRRLRQALAQAQAEGLLRADVEVGALASVIGSSCVGSLHQWVAGLIDDQRFRAHALLALDLAVAAAATDPHRERLLAPLQRPGTPRAGREGAR